MKTGLSAATLLFTSAVPARAPKVYIDHDTTVRELATHLAALTA